MKNLLSFIFLLLAIGGYAQEYQFDYLLEYETKRNDVNIYINSVNSEYVLRDDFHQYINTKDSIISFKHSLRGKIVKDEAIPQYGDAEVTIKLIESSVEQAIEQGYKCHKYSYKISFLDNKGRIRGSQVVDIFISNDLINSASHLSKNSLLIPEGIKIDNLPKGTVVSVYYHKNNKVIHFMKLKNIAKLEKPLIVKL